MQAVLLLLQDPVFGKSALDAFDELGLLLLGGHCPLGNGLNVEDWALLLGYFNGVALSQFHVTA